MLGRCEQVLCFGRIKCFNLGGLIDGSTYYVRFVDADTIELFDNWLNATTITSTTGRKDITSVSPDTSLHLFTSGSVMPESNNIRIFTHQYASGDGVVYRAVKMGAIGGLVDGTTYYWLLYTSPRPRDA